MATKRAFGRPIQAPRPPQNVVVPVLGLPQERKAFGALTNNRASCQQQQENRPFVKPQPTVKISTNKKCSSKSTEFRPLINDENFSIKTANNSRKETNIVKSETFQVFQDETSDSSENKYLDERQDDGVLAEKNTSYMMIDADDDDDVQMHDDDEEKGSCQDNSVLERSDISYVLHYNELEELSHYSSSIHLYMLEQERKFMPEPFYMDRQVQINSKMRSILVDWLIDVTDEYKMKDETLFLAVNYIDRFLSNYSISRQDFQLLGTAALLIAAKYEEVYPPQLCEFVFITDDAFDKERILVMEKTILQGLSFDVSVPTCNYFLDFYSVKLGLDKSAYCLAKYLMFLTALECKPFLKYYPSEIALCSILLAMKIHHHPVDEKPSDEFLNSTFVYEASLGDRGNVIQLMEEREKLMEALNQLRLYAHRHPQQAAQKKYSESKYYHASKIADEANI